MNNILVTRGTIIAAEQNPGLMEGFLAHEMGHITYGHSFVLSFIIVMESCGRASSYVLEKINWFLAEVVGRIPLINLVSFFIVLSISLNFIILGVFNKITNYIILWFFRQDEHAADGYACKIGFGPELLHGLELLEKVQHRKRKKGYWPTSITTILPCPTGSKRFKSIWKNTRKRPMLICPEHY